MPHAYVLLSGGLDSTVCLYHARAHFKHVVGLSVNYGQRHVKEVEYARATCDALDCGHHTFDISAVMPKTTLTDKDAPIPDKSYDELSGVSPTYVPYRNGLLLSTAASFVQGMRALVDKDGIEEWALYFGAHAEDARAWAYPDCTPEFIGAMANAIYIGSYKQLRLFTPLAWCDKADIVRMGERYGVKWGMTWSCYRGGAYHCGTCPTCRARRAGFAKAGVQDPTQYAVSTY